jgi:hypothetical protein
MSPRKPGVLTESLTPADQPKPRIELRQVYKIYESAAGDFPAPRNVWVMLAAMHNQFGGHAMKTE